jgi:lambda family phage portal protein
LGKALFDSKPAPSAPRNNGGGRHGARMYANAIPNRLNQGFPSYNTSADAELVTSLRNLRARSRALIRDAAFAKNAKRVITNNVVGTGVRLQAMVANTRGGLNQRINDSIEKTWSDWCKAECCHTGGSLHFHDMERMAIGQVFEAGEIFIRIHRYPFGPSKVPFALEIIEPERVVDGYAQPAAVSYAGQIRMGIELDKFMRPVAYWIRDLHPGDIRINVGTRDRTERVLAADIFHLRLIDRWPQTRGEPWMHAVAAKLADMNGYSEAEIIAARGAANFLGVLETPESPDSLGQEQPDGTYQMPTEPGTWFRALPGEKANFISPNRPNSALDPFMRFMLREVAAGTGVSYESLSRDYSQGNYSSTRLALLDDRDVWRSLQQWFVRSFRVRLHEEWMTQANLAGAIEGISSQEYFGAPEKFNAAFFRPRGWSWVDPTKEVAAFKEAVKAGFTTVGDVIAATSGGSDLEDVMRTREDEIDYMKSMNLYFDTSPDVYVPAETRGQMILTEDGIEPAATAMPAPGAPPVMGADGKPIPVEPEPEPEPKPAATDGDEDEPADAEGDDDERAVRRRRNNLRLIGGQ